MSCDICSQSAVLRTAVNVLHLPNSHFKRNDRIALYRSHSPASSCLLLLFGTGVCDTGTSKLRHPGRASNYQTLLYCRRLVNTYSLNPNNKQPGNSHTNLTTGDMRGLLALRGSSVFVPQSNSRSEVFSFAMHLGKVVFEIWIVYTKFLSESHDHHIAFSHPVSECQAPILSFSSGRQ